jgi:hypothetical protein
MSLPVKSEPHSTYIQPALPIWKIMLAFPSSAGLSAVTVAEPQPLLVTLASVSLKTDLVTPHWRLAAAVNSAICVAPAGPAVTGEADGTAGDRLGLADGEVAAALADGEVAAGLSEVALALGVAVAPAAADDGELAPPQAAARRTTPSAKAASTACLACRRVSGTRYAIACYPFLCCLG